MAQDEPIFDLIAQLLGTSGKQKQIFRQGNKNVRSHLGLGVLSLQFATIANQIWSMPFRTISHIKGAFARFMHILQLYGVLDDFRRKTVIFE